MTAALAITIGLGYIRFVRRQGPGPGAAESPSVHAGQMGDLERRVQVLEDQVAKAAAAFRSGRD
jgi:hypothetical protein